MKTFMPLFAFIVCIELDAKPLPNSEVDCDLSLTEKGIENIDRFVKYQRDRPDSRCQQYGVLNARENGLTNGGGFWYHEVCRERERWDNKVFIAAEIHPEDLGQGTGVDEAARKRLKEFYKLCGADEAGHAIDRRSGGKGLEHNLVAQNHQLNRGLWNVVMSEVSDHLNKTLIEQNLRQQQEERDANGTSTEKPIMVYQRHAIVEYGFLYAEKLGRPTRLFYILRLFDEGTEIKAIYGRFDNVDHTKTKLKRCKNSENKYYYFVYDKNEKYYARKTCSVAQEFRHLDL